MNERHRRADSAREADKVDRRAKLTTISPEELEVRMKDVDAEFSAIADELQEREWDKRHERHRNNKHA